MAYQGCYYRTFALLDASDAGVVWPVFVGMPCLAFGGKARTSLPAARASAFAPND